MLMGDTRKVWGDWERRFVMLGRKKMMELMMWKRRWNIQFCEITESLCKTKWYDLRRRRREEKNEHGVLVL